MAPPDTNEAAADSDPLGLLSGREGRRAFLRKAVAGGAIAGGAWVAPSVLGVSSAGAAFSGPCPSPNRYFGWNASGYSTTIGAATGWRDDAPGTGGPINVSDWYNHPTYTNANLTTLATDVRLRFGFVQDSTPPGGCTSTTYLNTANTGEAHGVSAQGTTAVSWQSYRFSKDGVPDTGTCNPTVGQILRFRITFTNTSNVPVTVNCPTVAIADIDNWLTAAQAGSLCSSPYGAGGNGSYWMDQVFVRARSVAGGADDRTVQALATGTNLNGSPTGTASLSGGGSGWRPIRCEGVVQTASTTAPPGTIPNPVPISDLYLQVQGDCQQIDICYQSGYNDTEASGRQHIGIGPITFSV